MKISYIFNSHRVWNKNYGNLWWEQPTLMYYIFSFSLNVKKIMKICLNLLTESLNRYMELETELQKNMNLERIIYRCQYFLLNFLLKINWNLYVFKVPLFLKVITYWYELLIIKEKTWFNYCRFLQKYYILCKLT